MPWNSCLFKEEPTSDIHYLWMGPPPNMEEYIGQDRVGPDLLREKHPKLKIKFWCLEEHLRHYKKAFHKKKIEVKAVEPFIKTKLLTADLLKLINTLKASARKWEKPADKARDNISIKELMQYYLQQYFDGFFMDTNVIPSPRQASWIEPTNKNKFIVPRITSCKDIDAWLMFSPKDDPNATKRFSHFFKNLEALIQARDPSTVEIDRKEPFTQRDLFIDTIDKYGFTYSTISTKDTGEDVSDFLSLQKRYHNSHRIDRTYSRQYRLIIRLEKDKDATRELSYYRERRAPEPESPTGIPSKR